MPPEFKEPWNRCIYLFIVLPPSLPFPAPHPCSSSLHPSPFSFVLKEALKLVMVVWGFSERLPLGQGNLGWKFPQLKNQYFSWGRARQQAGPFRESVTLAFLQLVLISSNFKSLNALDDWFVVFSVRNTVEGTKRGLWGQAELARPSPFFCCYSGTLVSSSAHGDACFLRLVVIVHI